MSVLGEWVSKFWSNQWNHYPVRRISTMVTQMKEVESNYIRTMTMRDQVDWIMYIWTIALLTCVVGTKPLCPYSFQLTATVPRGTTQQDSGNHGGLVDVDGWIREVIWSLASTPEKAFEHTFEWMPCTYASKGRSQLFQVGLFVKFLSSAYPFP